LQPTFENGKPARRSRKYWCERGDSNPHGFTRQILSLVRLPIPPLSQIEPGHAKSRCEDMLVATSRVNSRGVVSASRATKATEVPASGKRKHFVAFVVKDFPDEPRTALRFPFLRPIRQRPSASLLLDSAIFAVRWRAARAHRALAGAPDFWDRLAVSLSPRGRFCR
jgi:hypothetical protein